MPANSPMTANRDDACTPANAAASEAPEQQRDSQSPVTQQPVLRKSTPDAQRRPAFLCCKWPEGTDWCVDLAAELRAHGMIIVHDARLKGKLHDVETVIRDCSCVILLVTAGFYHALANRPPGNRALKEVRALKAVLPSAMCATTPTRCGNSYFRRRKSVLPPRHFIAAFGKSPTPTHLSAKHPH